MGHLNAQDIIAVNRPERSFSIHRLVGARILDQLDDANPDGKWQATFDMAVELLFDKFPRQEMGLWLEEGHETCQLYLHHIQSLARHYRNLPGLLSRNKLYELLHSSTWYEFEIPFLAHQCRAPLYSVMVHAPKLTKPPSARFMFEKGWYGDIPPYTTIALAILQDMEMSQSLEAALILNTIGSLYQETRNFSLALANKQRVLEIRAHLLSPNDPVLSNALHNLACIHSALRDHAKANELCDRAIEIREKLLDPSPEMEKFKRRSLPINYTSKARIQFLAGNLADAEVFGRKAVQSCVETFNEKHYLTTQ